MTFPWKVLDLLFSFLGKASIVIMMGGMLLRAPGFSRLEDLWVWVAFHTACCVIGFAAHIRVTEPAAAS